jgi:hypothetical protein
VNELTLNHTALAERHCLTSLHAETYTRRRLMIESPIRTRMVIHAALTYHQVARVTEEIEAIG